jgi:hypothetical protein
VDRTELLRAVEGIAERLAERFTSDEPPTAKPLFGDSFNGAPLKATF